MSNKLIVVLGATGTQGGSVVDAILKHNNYTVRGVTRDPDAPASKALKEKGVDVVSANLTDKQSLVKAFEGAYAVFGVTIPFTQDSEELQGRNIVDAAKEAKVPLLVWSSLPGAREASNGKYTTIRHFDQKSAVDKYIATAGQPTVILHTGGFAENVLTFQQLNPDPTDHNKWNLVFPILKPDTVLPGIWIGGDLGNIVVAIADHWDDDAWKQKLTKEVIPVAGYDISGQGIVDTIAKVSGKEVTYVRQTEVPEFLAEVYHFAEDQFYSLSTHPKILEELGVKAHSFEDYVRAVVLPYMQSKQ
ncbi:NAD(P)-binding protein [Calocera cornea HHB12733]|uniref:NAD(P)-binding protein n=1 Tax=Calocera cornea HHB12733 TaxID=1353952 RepID=A0A165HZP0_9BASI|nr:NAD(P)-binding protein [Calocera cornea HHB12733]